MLIIYRRPYGYFSLQPVGGLLCPTMHLDCNVLVTSCVAGREDSQWVGWAVVLSASCIAKHTNTIFFFFKTKTYYRNPETPQNELEAVFRLCQVGGCFISLCFDDPLPGCLLYRVASLACRANSSSIG